MSRPRNALLSYRKDSSGQAVVTVRMTNGTRRDMLLGSHGTKNSLDEYRRICALIDSEGIYPAESDGLTVSECILKYVRFAIRYYGDGTSGLNNVKRSLKTVRELYGPTQAVDFGPKALKLVQNRWIEEGITRLSINKMTGTVKRAFRWLVSEELIPAEVYQRLLAVEGLRAGKTDAPDNQPVKPADHADLEAALPYMPPMVQAIVQVQAATGARCGELLVMKAADVDRREFIWTFTPTSHKGAWRGKSRTILIGPKAQSVMLPYLERAGTGFVFSAIASEAERNAIRSANRKTPRYPSHMKHNANKRRKLDDRKRPPGTAYTTATVRRAIERACDAAGVPRFTPHRLRHLAALQIRNEFGLEHTRATLGHSVAAMTAHYSRETDARLAREVMAKMG